MQPVELILEYNKENYIKSLHKNYSLKFFNKYRRYFSVLLFIMAISLWFISVEYKEFSILFLVYSIFMFFKMQIYANKSLKNAMTNKNFNTTKKYLFSKDYFEIKNEESNVKVKYEDVYGYWRNEIGLLIYLQSNLYLYFDSKNENKRLDQVVKFLKEKSILDVSTKKSFW